MISEQTVLARAVSMSEGQSMQKGTPGVFVTFRLEDGPNKGSLIDWQGWYTEGTKARTAESLALCGYDFENVETIKKNLVMLVIEHEQYPEKDAEGKETGKMKTAPRVRWVNDPERGGSRFEAIDPAKRADMLSDLKALAMAAKKPGTGTDFPHGANAPAQAPPAASAAGKPKF